MNGGEETETEVEEEGREKGTAEAAAGEVKVSEIK